MPDYTLLLIDYDPGNLGKLTTLFEREGYRVEVARDGFSGIDKFGEIEPDLTLVEAMLPRKHGFEVCQTLKRTPHGKNSLVFIITAVYKGRRYRWQARHDYGADGYIEKPIDNEALLEIVRTALARRAEAASSDGPALSAAPPEGEGTLKAGPADA